MARIQNNMMAANTHRQYSINNTNAAKAAEKLSSGFRINRAGDDAAGLAISEKMRAQVRGLNMASKNSQDAISLVQTAEGALQEVHSMLQRMNELAVQANTGTNEEFDRMAISAEFEQLKGEIDDISNQTTFNNMKILDGTLGATRAQVAATSTLKVNEVLSGANGNYAVTNNKGMTAGKAGSYTLSTGTIGADGAFTADPDGLDIQVSFTDAKTGNVTNTTIKADKAYNAKDIADGKLFTLDLSSAGLGKYEIAATPGAGGGAASAADFVATLNGLVVDVTVPTPGAGGGSAITDPATTTNGKAAVTGANAKFEFDITGLTAGTKGAGANNLTLTINGIAITAAGLDDGADADAIGAALQALGTVTIDGQTFNISYAGSKLTFESTTQGTLNVSGYTATSGGDEAGTPLAGKAVEGGSVNGVTAVTAVTGETTIGIDPTKLAEGDKITIGDKTYGITLSGTGTVTGTDAMLDLSGGQTLADLVAAINGSGATPTGVTVAVDGTTGIKATQDVAGTGDTTIAVTPAAGGGTTTAKTGAAVIQVGASRGETLEISIDKMDSASLGIKNLTIAVAGDGAGQAGEAIEIVKKAINLVSEQRASLGAMQNRLEHKIANLDTSAENLQAAESRIRDVDMAKEMTNFTKQNILSQAATAMLAQANSAPQNVLQLLR